MNPTKKKPGRKPRNPDGVSWQFTQPLERLISMFQDDFARWTEQIEEQHRFVRETRDRWSQIVAARGTVSGHPDPQGP